MYQGRCRSAVGHLNDAISLYRSGPALVSILRNQVILAQAYGAQGDTVRARRMLDSAMAPASGVPLAPAVLLYLGQAQLRVGRLTAATATTESMRAATRRTSHYGRAV